MIANKHIEKYLEYYCDASSILSFAVLLKGTWGSGKTYFIKKYIESAPELDFLHISLYGICTTTEIDNKIFEAMHPVLSNPKLKLAARVLSGVVKFTTQIDLNSDGRGDVNVDSAGLSDINFKTFANNSNEKIIVFDDVERIQNLRFDIVEELPTPTV